ncbi:MAG: glycosyltransferase family 1 protein [Bacteroidia bacterium]|nr:glycosyltransferase family 1 protein [Bacteroidia bacterium]
MVIAVNTRLLLHNRLEGIGWFSFETLRRITLQHPEHRFVFIFDREYSPEFIFSDNIRPVVAFPPARHPFLWYWWFEKVIPSVLKKTGADLFLSPDGYLSLSTYVRSVAVMHDINFVHRPADLPFLYRKYFNHYFPLFAGKATRLATVSEYSKMDISTSFGIDAGKIDVVYNGSNNIYKPLENVEKEIIRKKYTDGNEYFIFIGSLHPRKNVEGLMLAYNDFRKSSGLAMKLVIVGEKMFRSHIIEKVYTGLEFRQDIIFTGRMEPDSLGKLTASALAMVFVPFFEGFGIPVLEAMQCDVPVITSDVTSLPEISGGAALLANPYSVDSIKNAMLSIAKDSNLRSDLVNKARIQREKFSWDKTAGALWNCIEKVI